MDYFTTGETLFFLTLQVICLNKTQLEIQMSKTFVNPATRTKSKWKKWKMYLRFITRNLSYLMKILRLTVGRLVVFFGV